MNIKKQANPAPSLAVHALTLSLCLSIMAGCVGGPKPEAQKGPVMGKDSILQTNIDPPADDSLQAFLENSKSARTRDTTAAQQVLTIGRRKISFAFYNEARAAGKFKHPFAATEAYRFLTGLPENELKLADLISKLRERAIFMCKPQFPFPGNPLQHKIAYSWGSKQYAARKTPPGEDDYCHYRVSGVDCSGFIYQLFTQSHLKMDSNYACSSNEKNPTFLKKSLDPYFGKGNYDVIDLHRIDTNKIISGDLLYFKGGDGAVQHIAIALEDEHGKVTYYAALGGPVKRKDGTLNMTRCTTNLDQNHGPVSKVLNLQFLSDRRTYGIVRITAKS